ncbi:MAG: DUF3604 domain-containing protein [Acidobacteria bacterium]|nr:DUF3604 domain-containing protein [Acidobacteriota bacterium]
MIPSPASPDLGSFTMIPGGPLTAGTRLTLRFRFEVGSAGLQPGAKLRVGVPNTGWEEPVPPQQRYWDELAAGSQRRLAPFHPVNTTASTSRSEVKFGLSVMERMLTPDEDPAFAYWRWWITFSLEEGSLSAGDWIEICYGDKRFGSLGALIQTFPEPHINATCFVDAEGAGEYHEASGSPLYLDVIAGPAARANVVWPSVRRGPVPVEARITVMDQVQAVPLGGSVEIVAAGSTLTVSPGVAATVKTTAEALGVTGPDGKSWGRANPHTAVAADGLNLYWGDLHAQSEHHVMHSQAKDFRQATWSKGISCGTLDECYRYAREVSLLDFLAMTDQGACLTDAWEFCQGKVREYHEPGRMVVFKGYEAGSPLGHRNVIYSTDAIDAPFDAKAMDNFHPQKVYALYKGRQDVIIIPHHVKTWTNWDYHDPELEPLMEIYSCWGQSETPGPELWNKGQTPGAGAWEAFRRGYRMGLMASTDNHVGMPGRSYPGDRQIHTPFQGGLCAVWAEELTRDSLFQALKQRRCYGTTGARIVLRFSIDGRPMGSMGPASEGPAKLAYEIRGTEAIDRLEVVHDLETVETIRPESASEDLVGTLGLPPGAKGFYYLRLFQKDGERAWSSPIWLD